MRSLRLFSAIVALSLLAASPAPGGSYALAQTTDEAEDAADDARERAEVASGMVNDAVANRDEIEHELAESITRLNELTAELSSVGADIDRIASQVGYADVELAGIQADIEVQAVDAYMTVVSSPSVSVVNSGTVEEAMVASSVVEDVVADGRLTVSQLFTRRNDLVELQEAFLADQDRYQELQAMVDEEVANYTALYEQADVEVAEAIRAADSADREYRAALSAVDLARAKEEERRRQENRREEEPTTTTSPATTDPGTDEPEPETTVPPTTTTLPDEGGDEPWEPSEGVEQWRGLVEQFFPANRVEEALRIIDCESNGNPNAQNPYSGAGGLFQFLPSTWASNSPNAGYGGYSVFDAEANIATAAWLANRYQELGYSYWHPWNCKHVLD